MASVLMVDLPTAGGPKIKSALGRCGACTRLALYKPTSKRRDRKTIKQEQRERETGLLKDLLPLLFSERHGEQGKELRGDLISYHS